MNEIALLKEILKDLNIIRIYLGIFLGIIIVAIYIYIDKS